MSKTFFIFLILFTHTLQAQKLFNKSAKISLSNYNTLSVDGTLCFEIDVRISDCLSHIELKDSDEFKSKKNIWDKIYDWWWFKIKRRYDFQISKQFILNLAEDNYHLRDNTSDVQIYMKCELMSLKSLFGRKDINKKVEINIYSKSGKKIYTKVVKLNKYKIIQDGSLNLEH